MFNRPLICKPLHFCILKCLSIFQNSLPGYNIGSWFRVKLIFHTDQHILRGKTWIHPNKGIEPFMRIWTFDEDQPPNVQSISYFIHFKIKKNLHVSIYTDEKKSIYWRKNNAKLCKMYHCIRYLAAHLVRLIRFCLQSSLNFSCNKNYIKVDETFLWTKIQSLKIKWYCLALENLKHT